MITDVSGLMLSFHFFSCSLFVISLNFFPVSYLNLFLELQFDIDILSFSVSLCTAFSVGAQGVCV